jgi:hypothetical protein
MSSDPIDNRSAVIWQGFHHAWEYNHRLNRLGSYVRSRSRDGRRETVAGHTAASGTGGDVAHFVEYATAVEATGVAFQEGWSETTVECPRAVTAPFRIKIDDLALAPELVGREIYTVLLNGFDLYAQQHADKLIAFDLEVTDPVVYAGGTKLRFNVVGELCFDCRTAECQLWPVTLGMERVGGRRGSDDAAGPSPGLPPKRGIRNRPAFEQGVNWLKRQIAQFTDLENVKQSIVGRDGNRLQRRLFRLLGRQFYLRLLKWRIITPYVLRIPYLIVAGDADALHVTESALLENGYTWDAETEIHRRDLGSRSIAVAGGHPEAYAVNTFGFKQLSLTTQLDPAFGSSNPIQWGRGMHLLGWETAVRDITVTGGQVSGTLDLFYKSWSEAMNEVITVTTWGAVRSAGSASLHARLALLQFKDAVSNGQRRLPGQLYWPGGGLNARDDPRARWERPVEGEEAGSDA